MASQIEVNLISNGGALAARVPVNQLIVAGWTGRDRAAVEKHIRELEELGVKPPSTTPVYYRVAASRVTTSTVIQVARLTLSKADLKAVFRGSVDDSLAFPWLVVVPGSAFFRPWTLVTAAFTEAGLIEVRLGSRPL